MKLKKKHLELTITLIDKTELSLADSRIRDRSIKALLEQYKTFTEEKGKVLEKFCDKDEEEKPITTALENGSVQYTFTGEGALDNVTKEINTLLEEEVDIEGDNTKIKEFIEATNYKPKVGEMELIDEILALL